MKKCPKCEFIYEDDQSLCDMDGVLLILDSRTLPNLHALQTVPETTKTSSRRNRAVPAFATLILALVLGLVYYVSIQRTATQHNDIPPVPIVVSTSNPMPVENSMPASQPSIEEPKREPAKPAAAAAPAPVKKATAKPAPAPAKAKVVEKKDDSKVGNILKKTGRLLKKPFKL